MRALLLALCCAALQQLGFALRGLSPRALSAGRRGSTFTTAAATPKRDFFSFLKSDGPDFFDEDPKTLRPKAPAAAKPAAPVPRNNPKPTPAVAATAAAQPKKKSSSSSALSGLSFRSKPAIVSKPVASASAAAKPSPLGKPAAAASSVSKPLPLSKPLSTVKVPVSKPLTTAASSSSAPPKSAPKVSAKAPPAQQQQQTASTPLKPTATRVDFDVPEFVQDVFSPVVDVYNDIVSLPSTVEKKAQETAKSIVNTKEAIVSIPSQIQKKKQEVVQTVQDVVAFPGKVIGKVSSTVDALRGLSPSRKESSSSPSPSSGEPVFVVNAELATKNKAPKVTASSTFETIKETIYKVGDVIEGTTSLIQATGNGAVSAVQAAQRLPSDLERLGKTTAAKVDETKAGIDALVNGIEDTALSVASFGESVINLPQTVEAKVAETQRTVESIKSKVTKVQDMLQGKPSPPKPAPKPKPPSDFQRAVNTVTTVGKAGVWGVTKGVEFVSWLTEKRADTGPTPSAPPGKAAPTPSTVPLSEPPKVIKPATVDVEKSATASAPVIKLEPVVVSVPTPEPAQLPAPTTVPAPTTEAEVLVATPAVVATTAAPADAPNGPRRSYSPYKPTKKGGGGK